MEGCLAEARAEIDRVDALKACALQREGALLVDIRPFRNRLIGLRHATDLIGGFHAWEAAGLPVADGGSPAVT